VRSSSGVVCLRPLGMAKQAPVCTKMGNLRGGIALICIRLPNVYCFDF